MNFLIILNNLCPILMVAAPIYLVLRLNFRGIFYGAFLLWLLGVALNMVNWRLHGINDSFWLILGLPVGLFYGVVIYVLKGCFSWGLSRFHSSTGKHSPGFGVSIAIAVVVAALFWQMRPYGMGTASMIGSLHDCSQDQVKFVWNEPWYFHNRGVIDLQKGVYGIGGDDQSNNEFGGITLTMGGASVQNTQLSAEQIARVKELLKDVPTRQKFFFQRYDFNRNVYLSFWKNGQFEVLDYDRRSLPKELADLFEILEPRVAKAIRGDQ